MSYNVPTIWRLRLSCDSDSAYDVVLFQTLGDYISHYTARQYSVPSGYFAPPAGTFAFSSSTQFRMRLMCVTGGRDGAGRASVA